jgi:hypothetical protein
MTVATAADDETLTVTKLRNELARLRRQAALTRYRP